MGENGTPLELVPQEYTTVRLEDVTLHPDNPRKGNLEVIGNSIAANGFYGALVVQRSTGRVLAGNHRLLAAQEAGASELPAILVDVDDDVARRILLADNRTSDLGTYDAERLLALLESVGPERFSAVGYTAADFRELRARIDAGLRPNPDVAPDVPQEPKSVLGEVYELGDHRVMCGDATNPEHVTTLFGSDEPGLCVTDPPYGVSYDPKWRNVEAAKGRLAYAARRVGEVPNDDRADWREAWALFPGDVLYSWHPAGATSLVHADALQDSGFVLRMQIIWAKSNFPIGRGDYHVRHEPCWYAVRKGKPAQRTRDRTQTTLWEINLDPNVQGGHSTQKPVECMARAIRNHSFDEVYDPFVGSGTTVIAAEREGRVCYAMELTPAYCDVTRQRYADYIGDQSFAP